jgi:methylamine dehydrogenase accessory protein MauD
MTALVISNLVLWVLVLVLALVVLALTRQLGVLHERISPAGALITGKGPVIGERAPVVDVVDISGRAFQIGRDRGDGRSTLVLFVSPSCPVCKSLLPVIKSSNRAERAWLDILLASDGDVMVHEDFVHEEGLNGIPYVLSARLGLAYQIAQLPSAVLIDSSGVLRARGLVNSREHLESLFEAQRLGVASLQAYAAGESKP